MEFKGKHFDNYRQAQLCKKCKGFGPGELPKTANDTEQTDFENQKQNTKGGEKQIKAGYYGILLKIKDI